MHMSAISNTVITWSVRISTLPTSSIFFFNDTATTEIYTLSLHDALPISGVPIAKSRDRYGIEIIVSCHRNRRKKETKVRSEEHTSELQSQSNLVCRLLLEKKNNEPARDDVHDQREDDPH